MKYEIFLNDKFKILKYLCENEVEIQGKRMIRLSQEDIAQGLNISRTKVNFILRKLVEENYVEMIGFSKYIVCEQGKKAYKYLDV